MKKCLFVGATSDIAQEMVVNLLQQNYQVIASYRDGGHYSTLLERGKGLRGHLSSIELDVESRKSFRHFRTHCRDRIHKIDLFINAIGLVAYGEFSKLTSQEISRALWVNLQSAIELAQVALPLLQKSDARTKKFVQFGSMAGFGRGQRGFSVYSAAKEGLVGFLRSVSHEYKEEGIYFYLVRPAGVGTRIVEKAIGSSELSINFNNSILDIPSDVATGVVRLIGLTPSNSFSCVLPTQLSRDTYEESKEEENTIY